MTEPDATLFVRASNGDTTAFELLLGRYFRAAYLVALAQLGEPAEAEDACQDAFVRGWERLADCRSPELFGAWLLRIVRNTAHNRRDYLSVRATSNLDAEVSAAPSPHADAERRELAGELRAALAQLGETQREVTLLHDVEGYRHNEIAAVLEISEEMSRRSLSDARKRLRGLLAHMHDSRGYHDE